jgi:hypothetical protein
MAWRHEECNSLKSRSVIRVYPLSAMATSLTAQKERVERSALSVDI